MSRIFNEDTRVKIPAIITLTRLGYKYISLKDKNLKIDEQTNIFTDIFKKSIKNINSDNPDIGENEISLLLSNIKNELNSDDLGKSFYKRLVNKISTPAYPKLIDFEDFSKNTLNVVTELTYKNGDDNFRPDITLLINGMPLAFIEVKIPNNKEGIIAERNRMNSRFQNEKFKRFINISQILVFSNNQEYVDNDTENLQGAFYSSTSKTEAVLNRFREEEKDSLAAKTKDILEEEEDFILRDNNYSSLKYTKEFITNKDLNTPTNSILLSLFSKERIYDFLQYGLAYVEFTDEKGINHFEKHIMRYPQFFASKAIQNRLNAGEKKGIIWHTQGSGKTALAYFNVKWLTDYFQKSNIIPKFYFIVDRISLKDQAIDEFVKRGLLVKQVSSKEKFKEEIQKPAAIDNNSGKREITVVNIQKFSEDSKVVSKTDYAINTQRVYFIDEAHRGYKPEGCFLANLAESDPNAIMISLTGTPLLRKTNKDKNKIKLGSKDIFGNYIHKYYYNQSIADGYTVKLIREDIETHYKNQMKTALADIEIEKGSVEEKLLYSHKKFINPMLSYIVDDLEKIRITLGDDSIGAMVVCHSSEQAEGLYSLFKEKYENKGKNEHSPNKATLILYDTEDKQYRKEQIDKFKKGGIDILFVYNMLLTGFDSPRLKKMYLNREVKEHNLLQTLTRVNRPYKNIKNGYIVDFVNIKEEFDKTNKAYWDELNEELGDEISNCSDLFKSEQEIEQDIKEIENNLYSYDTDNLEEFRKQIDEIKDKQIIFELRRLLQKAKELNNIIRYRKPNLKNKLDFNKFKDLLNIIEHRMSALRYKDIINNKDNTVSLINEAMEDIVFQFIKVGENELKLADDFRDIIYKTRNAIIKNIDQKDLEFITLKEQLEKYFKSRNFVEHIMTSEDINKDISILTDIYNRAIELNRKNSMIQHKYQGDDKFVRIYKGILRDKLIDIEFAEISKILMNIKNSVDREILKRDIINNKSGFKQLIQSEVFNNFSDDIPIKNLDILTENITEEYIKEGKLI